MSIFSFQWNPFDKNRKNICISLPWDYQQHLFLTFLNLTIGNTESIVYMLSPSCKLFTFYPVFVCDRFYFPPQNVFLHLSKLKEIYQQTLMFDFLILWFLIPFVRILLNGLYFSHHTSIKKCCHLHREFCFCNFVCPFIYLMHSE